MGKNQFMKINIFGVGRSGTKAVQLYIAFLLSQENEAVRLNYEPYFWCSRFGNLNYKGLNYHLNEPQFCLNAKDFSHSHKKYLKGLVGGNFPVVSKFIRGNGRINAINETLRPDHSILIIRDLYQVLNSLLQQDWDLSSVGYSYFKHTYRSYWPELKKHVKELKNFPFKNRIEQDGYSLIHRNAYYWYAMNRFAIENAQPDLIILPYNNITKLNSIVYERLGIKNYRFKIDDEVFFGKNIHSQAPLINIANDSPNKLWQKLNEFIFFLNKGRLRAILPPLYNQPHGDLVRKNEDYKKYSDPTIKVKTSISKIDLFDFFYF
jgi:hypothetical protein